MTLRAGVAGAAAGVLASPGALTRRVLAHAEGFARAHAQSPAQAGLLHTAFLGLRAQVREAPEFLPFVHLPLLVHGAVRGGDEAPVPLAAATTLLFLGIDILDDLSDGDRPRHWAGHPDGEVSLAGHILICALAPLAIAHLRAPPDRVARMQRIVAQGLLRMGAGQLADLAAMGRAKVDAGAVEAAVAAKSGEELAIFAALGAELAGAADAAVAAWAGFGRALGTAAQLASDCYELFRERECRDLTHGARTLPIAFHLQRLRGSARTQFLELLERARTDASAHERVRAELYAGGALRYSALVIECYCRRAGGLLQELDPHEPARTALQRTVEYASLLPSSPARRTP